jgi:hypothetical protein
MSMFSQLALEAEIATIQVDDGTATFGYAQDYNSGTQIDRDGTNIMSYNGKQLTRDRLVTRHELTVASDTTVDPAMQGAVYRGLYQTDWNRSFNCSSNCTWEQPCIALGLASSCANVTLSTLSTKNCTGSICNMTTPGGVFLTAYSVKTDWQIVAIVTLPIFRTNHITIASAKMSPGPAVQTSFTLPYGQRHGMC